MNGLTIFCQQPEPYRLRIADVTPADQADYPAPDLRLGWRFTLLLDERVVLTTQAADARHKPWWIDSRDFGLAQFESGVYELRLELLGRTVGSRRLAHHFIRTPLLAGESVWVRRNGAYYNETANGTREGSDWSWQALQSFDRYDHYQVRAGGGVVRTEEVIVDVVQETTYQDTGTSVLLAGSQTRVLCRSERVRWAQCVHQLLRIWLAPKLPKALPNADAETKLYQWGAQLDLLEAGLVVDAGVARSLLLLIKTGLSAWK